MREYTPKVQRSQPKEKSKSKRSEIFQWSYFKVIVTISSQMHWFINVRKTELTGRNDTHFFCQSRRNH